MGVTIARNATDLPVRAVGVDDLFFSTTDDKGVIEKVNEVFSRIAGSDELVGSPHNVIRHPDMPGGVFRLMWDTLEAGKPFVGYVRNKSIDDHTYDVLATVTPLASGGYLSVRTRPMTQYFEAAGSLYYEANDLENWVKGEGLNRREAAERGEQKLAEELEKLGYSSYEQLQLEILPAEVAAREIDGTVPDTPILAALGEFMDFQEEVVAVIGKIKETSSLLEENATAGVSEYIASVDLPEPELTLTTAPLKTWVNLQGIIDEHVSDLKDLLARLEDLSAHTRFSIALARLHATITADNEILTEAMRAGVDEMIRIHYEHSALTRRVSSKVRSVSSLISIPRELIMDWLKYYDSAQVRDAVDSATNALTRLGELADSLEKMKSPGLDRLDEVLN